METANSFSSSESKLRRGCHGPGTIHSMGRALISRPSSALAVGLWNGPYLDELPKEAWGNDFLYEYKIFPYLFSTGADGKVGGDGNDSDIYYEREPPTEIRIIK